MLDIKCFEIKERSLSSHLIQFKLCFFIIQGALYRECPTDQIKTLNLFDYAEEVKFLLKNGTPPHSWVIKLTHDPLYICVYVHARACVYSHIYVYKFIYIHQLFHLLSCLYHMRRYMWITSEQDIVGPSAVLHLETVALLSTPLWWCQKTTVDTVI